MCEAITNTNGNRVQYYNASCNIDRCGTIKLRYYKVNLWGDERKTFTKGDVHEVSQSKELGPLEEAEKLWDAGLISIRRIGILFVLDQGETKDAS
jgi:hypothetical protein